MRWNRKEYPISLLIAVILSALLVVGLLSLMTDVEEKERKRAKPEEMVGEKEEKTPSDSIRVVIKTNGFRELEHSKVSTRADSGLVVHFGEEVKEYGGGEEFSIALKDERLQKGKIVIEPKQKEEKVTISSLSRGYGTPSYRGKIELYSSSKGIVIVNELPLEEYLYAVVPSEMPASYHLEALKAQAVCARSYAEKQTRDYAYPQYQAHVDDSVSFQVYGNSKEQENTIQAVNETTGEKVWHHGEVATTYYFSTSCGKTTSAQAWGSQPSEANSYLQTREIKGESGCYEKKLPWYRWKARIPEKTLGELIRKNTGKEIGNLVNVEVTKRGAGDVALQIVATGDKGSVTVDTENKIRSALGGDGYIIERNDGKKVKSKELLPSAFFTIRKGKGEYLIEGGGYGHGIGMSQNGANEMAKEGKTYREILETFYQEIEIRK